MNVWAPPPFRVKFDEARDPYTARNALGITGGGVSSATPPLSITSGVISIDLTGYQPIDADLTAISALTGTNTIYYTSAANTWSPVNVSTGLAFSGGNLTCTLAGGNVSNVGTPVSGQFAQWTGATTIQGITAAAAGAAIAPAWTAYTPTITAGSGTFTTVSATGRYLTIGKVTHVKIEVNITTNGTAAGYIVATLPNTAVGFAALSGRERNVSGKMLAGMIGVLSSTTTTCVNYDNTYPGANGASCLLNGSYENT